VNALKGKSDIIAIAGLIAGVGGVGYSEHKNSQRHREIMEATSAGTKVQEELVKSQIEIGKQMAIANELKKKSLNYKLLSLRFHLRQKHSL